MNEASQVIPVVGLVGGVGSGKSAIAAECLAQGCGLIDADKLGHDMLTRPDIRDAIVRTFGEQVLAPDGSIDRKALGGIVFDSPRGMDALNAIMHPPMGREMVRMVEVLRQKDVRAIVVDAAVLFEAGWDAFCDTVVFVDAPEDVRLARVREARGWDAGELARRENAQIPLDKKRQLCDHVLVNHANDSRLSNPVQQLLSRITHCRDL
jgi:dephospho-CoA kinase